MNYLTIEQIKKQCRIDSWFTDDDEMLADIGDGAESFLEAHLNISLDSIASENGGELPKNLVRALLMFCDYLYDASGSGKTEDVPNAFYVLTAPFKNYTIA